MVFVVGRRGGVSLALVSLPVRVAVGEGDPAVLRLGAGDAAMEKGHEKTKLGFSGEESNNTSKLPCNVAVWGQQSKSILHSP